MKRILLKTDHVHAGVLRRSGTEIEVNDVTADWMQKHMDKKIKVLGNTPSPSKAESDVPVLPSNVNVKE